MLRIGHRPARDKRITTHVALVARTFGAEQIWIDEKDERIEETVRSVTERFGGKFKIETGSSWRGIVKKWKDAGGIVAHLTMYGIPVDEAADAMDVENRDVLLVVGAEKVPRDIYDLADFNVAVGNQPHSEVAALAIALDRITKGSWPKKQFSGGTMAIEPNERGKTVITR